MSLSVILFILLLFSSSIITFDDYLENLSVNTGETATFICDLPERYSNKLVDFYGPTGRLLVKKTGENIGSDDRTRFMLEHIYAWTWSLILSDVSDDDAGEYTCRISSNNRTLTIIKRFNLTVLTPPKIVDITIESTNHGILIENEQIMLKCLARGIPQPKILWEIPEKKFLINKKHDRNIIIYDNKLIIRNFSRTTPMNYQCIADNGIPPRDTRTRHLVPAIPPEMIVQSSLSRFSSQILLNCTIIARPLTSAKWKRNRIEINNIKRIEINDYTIQLILLLQIDPLNYTNTFGMYECQAENQFKVAKAFIIIDETILSNITIGKQARISSSSSSSPTYAQIELLLNGSLCLTYNFYVILFINILFVNYSTGFYNKR
ncbi:unnamed protein product [Rotaria sordida]|uniref:Ig-like domain-containing protein n=1 Tax=Rotaria sordida TaxID=392033 RepID=A0A819UF82_9BILA|nr:unnamed protein product [Rotaria sordida]CAF4093318.1 unnamed protein product [Rotaria sordida]